VADVGETEVGGDRVAVDLPVDAGESARSQRHHRGAVERELETQHVAGEHPEVGEQVMAEVDRLSALQVGVAGHRPVGVRFGLAEEALHRPPAELDRPQRVRLDDHRHVGGDLVVAGTTGVELPGERPDLLAEQALDRHMDVLVGGLELEPVLGHAGADAVEALLDPGQLIGVEDADPAEAAGVGLRLVDVVRRQPGIEGERPVEPPEAGIGVLAEAGHRGGDYALSGAWPRAAASSWQTRSTCASPIAGKNGSANESAAAASATGN
jgi:hypothetical protein